MQDNIHVPFHGSKKKLDPAQGTWKRLGPPPVGSKIKPEDKAIDPKHNLPSVGPKRKPVEQSHAHATSIDKKQKLKDEASTLKNFETDNLGWQWLLGSTAGSNEYIKLELSDLGTSEQLTLLKEHWKKEASICVFLMETKLSTDQLTAKKQSWNYN